jgi:hypothetical protein
MWPGLGLSRIKGMKRSTKTYVSGRIISLFLSNVNFIFLGIEAPNSIIIDCAAKINKT